MTTETTLSTHVLIDGKWEPLGHCTDSRFRTIEHAHAREYIIPKVEYTCRLNRVNRDVVADLNRAALRAYQTMIEELVDEHGRMGLGHA